MYLQVGSKKFPTNEVLVTSNQKRPIYSPRGNRTATRVQINFEGVRHGDDATDLTAELKQLQEDIGTNNVDVALYEDDGTVTIHSIKSANTIGGVKFTMLAYPHKRKTEYVTYQTYSFRVEADFDEIEDELLQYNDSVSITGTGGPRWQWTEIAEGAPRQQIVSQRTPVRIVQNGSAIGWSGYPLPAPPLFPSAEHVERRQINRRTPKRVERNASRQFEITWTYHFEFNTRQNALPFAR